MRDNIRITHASWMGLRDIKRSQECLAECPDKATREEGLACLKSARPGYIMNLIPQDHPDRIAAARWIMENF